MGHLHSSTQAASNLLHLWLPHLLTDGTGELARTEGVLVDVAGGGAVAAAIDLARDPAHTGHTIVVLLPSFGERMFGRCG